MRLCSILLLLLCGIAWDARAGHVMGGEITWTCNGTGYVFELVFYRDCQAVDANVIGENLRVWHHPTITSIPVAFVSRQDISPTCSVVPGSPPALDCGNGPNAGNGNGAIEKVVYRSGVMMLPGIPPAGTGWIFTFDNFSRGSGITNLDNPSTHGITIAATMFAPPNAVADVCMDNSPRFLQDAYMVSCASEDYAYNMHAADIDLDSLHYSFGAPMDHFPSGSYNPPANPAPIPFESGFSFTNPTPDASFQPGNIAAQLDPESGELTFNTQMSGFFVVKAVVESFRSGSLIARVEREMEIMIVNCTPTNNAPVITPPFAGSYETTVDAGTLVAFTIQSTDVELLQDGSPQNNILTASGQVYGTGFTSTSGCAVGPCATLSQPPAITGVQGVSTQFSWQTDCAHLQTAYGEVKAEMPYFFVFRIQDNYCQVPKTVYRTVIIRVRNPGIIPATGISCITTAANGDVTVNWNPVSDPDGTFVHYALHSVQNGLIGTYPIGTTSVIIPAPGGAADYFVNVVSGCSGNAITTSDTMRNVHLDLQNPNNGTATLNWNTPADTPPAGMSLTADILREYPAGTWTTIATVPYATTNFIDTIDICQAFLNYQVVYNMAAGCAFTSNIVGDLLEDEMTPDIPVLSAVSIDTLTGNVTISWNPNGQADTYGYVIYQRDANGFIVEIDTVYGINSTSYTYSTTVDGPLTYSVAAFDSCYTDANPPTFQTSAKGELHTSMFVSHSLNVCNNSVNLAWTPYEGWDDQLLNYTVYLREGTGPWTAATTVNAEFANLQLTPLSTYCVAICANRIDGTTAFSNLICFTVSGPTAPTVHYLQVATVSDNAIDLRHMVSIGSNVQAIRFEKFNPRTNTFVTLVQLPVSSSPVTYTDTDVDVHARSYRYRAIVIDSCGNAGTASNEAQTILLQVSTDQAALVNYLNWTEYSEFDGSVLFYHIYRGIDGIYDPNPIVSLPSDRRFYEDDVNAWGDHTGRFCYSIVAQEGNTNQYGISENSSSNEVCAVVEPLVYIPNAIIPGSINNRFYPVLSFTDLNKYEMTILDRWGGQIFQTTDITEAWDGTHANGATVELGVYVYMVRIVDGNNQELVYRGTVTVVR